MTTARELLEQYEVKLASIKQTLDRLKSAKAKAEITLAVFYARCLDHVSKQTIEKVGTLEVYQSQILNEHRKIVDVLQGLQDFDIAATPSGDVPHLDDCLDIKASRSRPLAMSSIWTVCQRLKLPIGGFQIFDRSESSDPCVGRHRLKWMATSGA
ncbi:hypothetical protein HDU87_006348 [Geranomyces variabilis]|uniref:Uncharacterized protein n=1 Tax=Geranomyces variabilis TaxID=109894 RepID=A0AAD5TFJ2_9FUNG|nr:hypothetical protein HDU87_006348 [Geranomyces variabilis]